MQQRSSPQAGVKRLRQQQLQLGRSSVDHSVGGGAKQQQQRFWQCPVCSRSFALFRLEDHVNHCLDNSPRRPEVSRSSSLTTGDVPRKISAVELFSTASIQGSGDAIGERQDVPTSPSSNSVSSVKTSGLQRPSLSGQRDEYRLSKERCVSLEGNLLQPSSEDVVAVLHCSGLQRSPFARQQDAYCLPTERRLSLEGYLLQPSNENVIEGGRGGFSVEEEEGGEARQGFALEFSGGNNGRHCGNTDLSFENMLTGDRRDGGGLDEKGMVEHGRDGNTMERPPGGFKLFQRQVQSQARLSMFRNFSSAPLQRKPSVTVLQPGMVLFRSWLNLDTQQKFVQESQGVAHLFCRPTTAGGGKYHVYSMCWGQTWDAKAHRYVNKGPEHPIPSWMFDLAQKLARDAHQHTPVYPVDSMYAPDVGLVNFYPVKADELGVIGLGGHQDLDDSGSMPVVSVSVGDSMTFFYRRLPPFSRRKSGVSISVDEEAARSCEDGDAAHNREHQILLESGDVLVFGGKSRLVYHGTRHVQPGTRPPGLHMVPGRLNFTFRQAIAKAV